MNSSYCEVVGHDRRPSPMRRVSSKVPGDAEAGVAVVFKFDKTNHADIRAAISESETSRSSTPVTDTSNWYAASTTSSRATSAHFDPEGCFVDDLESCNEGSDDEQGSPRSNNNDDMNPAADSTRQVARNGPRQSHLRNSMDALNTDSAIASSSSEQGSDESEPDSSDDEDDEPDNDWSGENDSFDATVIAAVDGDLGLAAFLIPLIHKDLNSSVKSKIEQWQYSAAGGSTGSTSSSGDAPSSSSAGQQSPGSNPRKRRRRSSSGDGQGGKGEEDEGDNDGGSGNSGRKPDPADDAQSPRLACPFYKMNPTKYTPHTQAGGPRNNTNYRTCSGPGFKNIQRLKEHLKRNHTPVQCERCYRLFPGSDRAACINQLTEHHQGEIPCERNDASLKEGISQAQWASLEKQNRKRNQEAHKVEKWFEIWKVLFPHMPPPESPWYDYIPLPRRQSSPSHSCEEFVRFFRHLLDYKVKQGDIAFPSGDDGELQQRITNLVRQTFKSYVNLRQCAPSGNLTDALSSSSLTGTGSGSANQSSLLGGSFTIPSLPSSIGASQQLTTTSVSTATASGSGPSRPQQALQAAPPAFAMGHGHAPNYAVAMPMNGQASQYQPQMPMPNFPAMGPQPGDMNNYYAVPPHMVFPGQAWPAGVAPYPAMPAHFGAANQLGPEFYGSPDGFAAGREGEFGEL